MMSMYNMSEGFLLTGITVAALVSITSIGLVVFLLFSKNKEILKQVKDKIFQENNMLSFSKFKKDDPEVESFAKNLVDVIFFTEDNSTMKFGFFNKVDGEYYIYYNDIIGKHYAERLEDCYVCVINVNWE